MYASIAISWTASVNELAMYTNEPTHALRGSIASPGWRHWSAGHSGPCGIVALGIGKQVRIGNTSASMSVSCGKNSVAIWEMERKTTAAQTR